jgi:hypothetical protein
MTARRDAGAATFPAHGEGRRGRQPLPVVEANGAGVPPP